MVSIGVQGARLREHHCLKCPHRPRMICRGMPDHLLSELGSLSTELRLDKGETLFFEGDESKHVFNVTEGFLRLSRLSSDGRRQVMGFLTTGDYVGHTSRDYFSLSAEALTPVKVCQFERKKMADLLQKYPAFERQFHNMTAGMLDDLQDLVFTLGRKNALERVASFLVHSLDRRSASDEIPGEIWLPMTRADIADFLGLTLETVSRAFSKLKKAGIIDIEHAHTIRVQDRGRLFELAEGD